jgi:hypothetical protein
MKTLNNFQVIFYYHKLLDLESNQETSNDTSNDYRMDSQQPVNFIDLELRIAIRQNLFTAHHRLGELKQCCFYLNEILTIADQQLAHTQRLAEEGRLSSRALKSASGYGHFDLCQVKMDATNELVRLYICLEVHLSKKKPKFKKQIPSSLGGKVA